MGTELRAPSSRLGHIENLIEDYDEKVTKAEDSADGVASYARGDAYLAFGWNKILVDLDKIIITKDSFKNWSNDYIENLRTLEGNLPDSPGFNLVTTMTPISPKHSAMAEPSFATYKSDNVDNSVLVDNVSKKSKKKKSKGKSSDGSTTSTSSRDSGGSSGGGGGGGSSTTTTTSSNGKTKYQEAQKKAQEQSKKKKPNTSTGSSGSTKTKYQEAVEKAQEQSKKKKPNTGGGSSGGTKTKYQEAVAKSQKAAPILEKARRNGQLTGLNIQRGQYQPSSPKYNLKQTNGVYILTK